MTDKATLLALAERVQGLDGPDRGLDGWIHAHMTRGERYIIGTEPGRFPQPPVYGERLDVMQQLTEDPDGAAQYIGAPHYTASLDAALTLVPEGHVWLVANVGLNDEGKGPLSGKCSAISAPPADTEHTEPCEAATPALALTAAALRARAETQP